MKTKLLRKYGPLIYVLILIFSVLFYFMLLGASGHGFNINSTDKFALIFILCGILIVPNYKNNFISNERLKTFITMLSLFLAAGTLVGAIYGFNEMVRFKFGADINQIVIILFYLVPLIFIIINTIVIKGIITELRK